MIALLQKCGLALAWFAPFDAFAQSPAIPPPTCKVLEAAYTAAIGSEVPAFPIDIRPAWRKLEPSKFRGNFETRMKLRPSEFSDLIANETDYQTENYRPTCPFTASPSRKTDKDGHAEYVEFTSPIFSSDRHLALVEISFEHKAGRFGYGSMCIVRHGVAGWIATCSPSWIS